MRRVDVQLLHHDLWVNVRHIEGDPHEDVYICSQEGKETSMHRLTQLRHDLNPPSWVKLVQGNRKELFCQLALLLVLLISKVKAIDRHCFLGLIAFKGGHIALHGQGLIISDLAHSSSNR